MKITEVTNEGLKRAYSIVVPSATVAEKVKEKLSTYAKTMSLPGFRPGKVPIKVIEQKHGKAVRGETIEGLINEAIEKLVKDNELRPIGQPSLTDIKGIEEDNADLELSVEFEVFPDFTTANVDGLEIERPIAELSEDEVTKVLENLASGSKSTTPLARKRKTRKGDTLEINFVGTVDGVAFEGGTGNNYKLELGSDSFIPGFEKQLEGAYKGDTVTVEVTFPEEYQAKELAGKAAVFETEIVDVFNTVPAEINDDLATKMGFGTLEELKKLIKDQRESEFKNMSRLVAKRQVLDALNEKHLDVTIPDGIVDGEFESIWTNFEQMRKENPDAIDDDDKNKSDDELKKEYKEIAQRRVRLALVVSELGSQFEVEVTPEEIKQAVMAEAYRYPGQEKQVIDHYQKNPQAMEAIRMPLFEDKVVDVIIEKAKVTDKNVSEEELRSLIAELS